MSAERHPATTGLLRWFEYAHLPLDLQRISAPFQVLALDLVGMLRDGSELTTALRKLLEAKDCAVRQRIADRSAAEQSDRMSSAAESIARHATSRPVRDDPQA